MRLTFSNKDFFSEAKILLDEGREIIFSPKGYSMRPFIEDEKDSVVIKKKNSVKVGDIVLVHINDDVYILHRIIAKDGEKLTLMGDGNLEGTEKCLTNDVLGTVIEIRNEKGRKKLLTKGWFWRHTLFARKYLLKFYRKIILKYNLL